MRRLAIVILALSLTALALPAGSSGAVFSQSKCDKAKTRSAKKKLCGNPSYDKKKCKKAKTAKLKRKYCVKRSAFTTPQTGDGQQQTGTNTTTPGGNTTTPGTTPDPGTGTTVTPPAGGKLVRDDATFAAGLSGYNFHRYEEGTVGYGEYSFNFCPGNSFVYRSYYSINGSAPESNDAGTYSVIEGYTVDTMPGTWLGVVDFTLTSGKVVRTVVAYRGTEGQVKSTDDNSLASGIYSATPGGAQYCG